jgi:hypothetical protein
MDKSTLSNYGWVVIAVLVLSVMIALATPFGSFIANGVKSTTQGLFDTQKNAFGAVNMVINNQTFPEKVELPDGVEVEITHKPTGDKLNTDNLFKVQGRDIAEGEWQTGYTQIPYAANEANAQINIANINKQVTIPHSFVVIDYGQNSAVLMSSQLRGKTMREMQDYTITVFWPDGSSTLSEFSVSTTVINGETIEYASIKYNHYNPSGEFEGSSDWNSMWLFNESTKTFELADIDLVKMNEQLIVYIDCDNYIFNLFQEK